VVAIKGDDVTSIKEIMKDLQAALVPFEKELSRRETTYFGGKRFIF